MDFGLAKVLAGVHVVESEAETKSLLTAPGMIVGTIPYMSPEQVRGESVDERSDTFSFGVVLYEMLTGHQPFAALSGVATISAILTKEPEPIQQLQPLLSRKARAYRSQMSDKEQGPSLSEYARGGNRPRIRWRRARERSEVNDKVDLEQMTTKFRPNFTSSTGASFS